MPRSHTHQNRKKKKKFAAQRRIRELEAAKKGDEPLGRRPPRANRPEGR